MSVFLDMEYTFSLHKNMKHKKYKKYDNNAITDNDRNECFASNSENDADYNFTIFQELSPNDFYVNLEKAVPFNDMQRQLVNDSQFHHAINAKNANCLAINDKNANCHAHMFSGYAHNP